METVQESFKPLRAIAVKEAPFDAAVVKKNATTILEKLKEAARASSPRAAAAASRAPSPRSGPTARASTRR
jgi:cytochrome c556